MSLPHNPRTDELFRSVLQLKSIEECYQYFEDLCTIREIEALGQRLEVAGMLKNGASYKDAGEKANASSATISRINRCLEYGSGGYTMILDRMGKT